MNKVFSKLTALCLAVLMLVSMLPTMPSTASAAETGGKFENAQLDIVSDKESTLAPGVTENLYTVYDKNGEQVKMYVATADISVDSVKVFASYKNMDPTTFGMSKLTEQVAAFDEKAAAGDAYYTGTVVAGINASYYNMVSGQPTGIFVMNGVVGTASESAGYFAIMKDGTAKIGLKGDYAADAENIQEAVGIYTMLIKNGEICSGLDASAKYVRQTIGITADGKVITMTADGAQAPTSIGLTVQEQAQVMLDLGCVWAGHLDGGGSGTYGSKPEGSDDFVITNNPSDGSERAISNGLLIVSTAAASYEFDHVVYDVENDYMTPGTSVAVSVAGASSTGHAAEIPAGVTYEVMNGTYVDGVFTAGNEVGDATITAMYNGNAIGTVTLNVVQPDALTFGMATMAVPFGRTVDMNLSATYGVHPVTVKSTDVVFTMSNDTVGVMDGFNFVAAESAENVVSVIIATLAADATVTGSTTVTLGKASVVFFDFEDGQVPDNWAMKSIYGAIDYGSRGELYVATAKNGQVHNGEYSLAVDLDYTNVIGSGYTGHMIDVTDLSLTFYKQDGVVGFGYWLYVPDGGESLYTRVMGWGKVTSSGKIDRYNPTAVAIGQTYTFDGPGWHYMYVDLSGHKWENYDLLNIRNIEFYMSDRDGANYGYYAADHASYYTDLTYYIDDITIDYSTAVDDREAPVITNPTYAVEGMADAAVLNGQTVTTNAVTFAASIAENTAKDNYTGLNEASVKVFVDGVEVAATFKDGVVSATDVVLADGYHTVKFLAIDNAGNENYIIRGIYVDANSGMDTVKLVPADPDANYLLWGSIYWMNLEATDLSKIDTVTTTIWLNGNNDWELDHMKVAEGFEATYTVDANYYATITITRTGKVTASGEGVLASLPLRVYCYEYNTGNESGAGKTNKDYPTGAATVPVDVEIKTYLGEIQFTDGTSGSFSAAQLNVDTEIYACKDDHISVATGSSWHYHYNWTSATESVLRTDVDWFETQNKAATCTEAGYTDRLFCTKCNSVVEWGTTIPATGHNYEVVDGVLLCACGQLFNGVYTDGKTYVDGVVIADGWTDDFRYYVDGVMRTGLQEIDGFYYDFGTEGICPNKIKLSGFYFNEAVGKYMSFAAGVKAVGEVNAYPTVHFFDENGYAISGDVEIWGYTCTFDEKGSFVSANDANVVDAGFVGTNLNYVLLADGTLKVGGEGVMKDFENKGLLPAWAIKNEMNAITSVVIGNGITHIGKFGFYRLGYVQNVSFEAGSSLKSIGWGAFGHNWRLQSVTIPASVEILGEYAFYECGALKSFDVEEDSKLHTIKEYAFWRDRQLQSVFIPDMVTTFGTAAFFDTGSEVVFDVVKGSKAESYMIANNFQYETREGYVPPEYTGSCSQTISWELYPDGTLKILGTGAMPNYVTYQDQPWANVGYKAKKIIIGKDITAIGNYAFAYTCSNVTEILFEEGSKLESVGVLSFMSCQKVTDILLPETVTSIGAFAFGYCFALKNVYIPQSVSYIYFSAFNASSNVVLNVSEGTYAHEFAQKNDIPFETREFVYNSIANGSCGENATWDFYENGELIISGSGAMTNYATYQNQPWANFGYKVKRIIIGKDITSIGNYAFAYTCSNATEIIFEEGSQLKSVGILSFASCQKVKSVVLPETVTSIGAFAFGYCFALKNVYIPQSVSYIYFSAFNASSNVVLNVSEGTYAHEFAQKNDIPFETREFVYNSIANGSCGENATWDFYENGELIISGSGAMTNYATYQNQPWANFGYKVKRIIIGKDITSIGNYAFAYTCSNATEIRFEEGSNLESIGVLSFMNCKSVKQVILPEAVTYIGAYGFGDCFALERLYIPQSMTSIYKTAFSGCTKLVLEVLAGTYGETFAVSNNIAYIADKQHLPLR